MNAEAFAQGNRVGFSQTPDLHTAAHEAAHVIQQRGGHAPAGGIDTPGDALEQHADAVADVVVAGGSAEALLDGHASSGGGVSGAVQRKAQGSTSPSDLRAMMEHYLYVHRSGVWRAVGTHLRAVTFPTPHSRLTWVQHDAFVIEMLKQLEGNIDDCKPLLKFDEVLYPTTAAKTIGPILPTTSAWSLEIGMAIAHALHIAVVSSIKRLAVRYLEVADSKGAGGEDGVRYDELITSMPIDRYIAVALCRRRVVSVEPPAPNAAKAAKGKEVKLRDIELDWMGEHDKTLWNWVRAKQPADATAEEVAAKLWVVTDGRSDNASFNAYLLASAPPLFGVPKRMAIHNAKMKPHAPPNALDGDDSVNAQLLRVASGKTADQAALQEGRPQLAANLRPSNAPAELGKVLEVLRDCESQLEFAQQQLTAWGFRGHAKPALEFVHRKQAELAGADAKKIGEWGHVFAGQKDRLSRIAGAINTIAAAADKLGIKDKSSPEAEPVREIMELLAVSVGVSHLAGPSEAKLMQALQQQASLSVRALQVTERNMMVGIREVHQQAGDNKSTNKMSHDAVVLQEDSRKLQTQLLNGQEVDPDTLEDVTVRSEEMALETKLYGTLDAIVDLNNAAIAVGKGDAAIIASLFSGKFRGLPQLTKHIHDELAPIRNNWRSSKQGYEEEERLAPSPARRAQNRAERRKQLQLAQQKFEKLAKDRDLASFFKEASETIKNQQFRTAVVKVAAMIGISIVAGAAAGIAARTVGGMLMQTTGAATVSELGFAARAGIAATRIGVDTTISSAGTAAIQGTSFTDAWKENLITSLASSAVFGSISRYAADQAKLEGKIATTWAQASKLGKLGKVGKELGAITAHTLWGAAMGEVAGRIVTGQSHPPPETLRDWALQGVSVAVGRHVAGRIMASSKLYATLENSAEAVGRGLVASAAKLQSLAKQVISTKQPNRALDLLNEHDKFLRKEIEAVDEAIRRSPKVSAELWAARDRLHTAAKDASSLGLTETKFALIGMEELIPGALWKGNKDQIQQAIQQAETDGQKPKVLHHDPGAKRWKVKIGDRTVEIQEVVSAAKTVNAERILVAGSDDDMRLATKLVVPKPGSIDVVVHGGVDDFMVTINGVDHTISHRSLAKYIKSRGITFKRVRLLACKAGMHPKGVAQHLANKLGVPVEAPSDKLYIHPDGTLTIGPHETRNTGRWEEFTPKKTEPRFQKAPEPNAPEAAPDRRPTSSPRDAAAPKALGAKALGPEQSEGSRLAESLNYPPDPGDGYHWAVLDVGGKKVPVVKLSPRKGGNPRPHKRYNPETGAFEFLSKQWEKCTYENLAKVEPCFPPGTPVRTPDGSVSIEALRPGDRVLSYDAISRSVVAKAVLSVHRNFARRLTHVHAGPTSYMATRMHRFFVSGGWTPARRLWPGTTLQDIAGQAVVVDRVNVEEIETDTYNLEVETTHNYYVGERPVLVHNGTGDDSAFAITTRTQQVIYGIYDTELQMFIYVGKSDDIKTRFKEHLRDKPHWRDRAHALEPQPLKEGHWTPYETAVWEKHLIEKHRLQNPKLENGGPKQKSKKVGNPISRASFEKFKDLHIPCK
jgi:hypothetical protein